MTHPFTSLLFRPACAFCRCAFALFIQYFQHGFIFILTGLISVRSQSPLFYNAFAANNKDQEAIAFRRLLFSKLIWKCCLLQMQRDVCDNICTNKGLDHLNDEHSFLAKCFRAPIWPALKCRHFQ